MKVPAVIWINGAFGSGKTQAAYALARRIPKAFVCDPEQLGFGLQRMTPPELRGDFQDIPLWRRGTCEMLLRHALHAAGPALVPMTLVNKLYFDEIVGELRRQGIVVQHVALVASQDTLLKRLRSRGEGAESWAAQQIKRCVQGLAQFPAGELLDTNSLSHAQVVAAIAEHCRLELQPDRLPAPLHPLRRLAVQLRHLLSD